MHTSCSGPVEGASDGSDVGSYTICKVAIMEPASLTTRTPSEASKGKLGTGGNLGSSIAKGGISNEAAPGTSGTSTRLISVLDTSLGMEGLGPGGGVGHGTSEGVVGIAEERYQ